MLSDNIDPHRLYQQNKTSKRKTTKNKNTGNLNISMTLSSLKPINSNKTSRATSLSSGSRKQINKTNKG